MTGMEAELAMFSIVGEEEDAWQLSSSDGMGDAMHTTLANLWHPLRGISISDLEDKRYLFRFYYEIDIEWVVEGSLLSFKNHLLVFHKLTLGKDPKSVPLYYVNFWVQIRDLPARLVFEGMAKQFEAFLGTFVTYDTTYVRRGVLLVVNLDGKRERVWEVGEQSNSKDPTVLEDSLIEISEASDLSATLTWQGNRAP
ncbi:hypothetical protein GOBAR_AA38880 [Gossypium barbadense]|uniref:DUF4283 domain-containing protein n=1 Tax=Gossypium barbadense TaxID=3634 RepID=A0A2P5VSK8_GOSBA|nr:hypothetical protein GOBAR_AA38880 [Gossypium barbadense]